MDGIRRVLSDLKNDWDQRTKSLVNSPADGSAGFSVETFDPMRVRFYLQVLSNPDRFRQILNEYDLGSSLRNTFHTAVKDLISNGKFIASLDDDVEPNKHTILDKVDGKLRANPITANKFFINQHGGADDDADDADGTSFFSKKLQSMESLDTWENPRTRFAEKKQLMDSVNEHPLYNPSAKKTTTMDIVIFIVTTYLFRCLALFLVEWAIRSQMASNLQDAFVLYLGIYIILFVIICLLVNTGDDEESLNPFKLIFYYLNTDINSASRIYIHVVLQLLLLPIMFIVKDPSPNQTRNAPSTSSSAFDQQQSNYVVVSNLTFFMWVITSIVATRL